MIKKNDLFKVVALMILGVALVSCSPKKSKSLLWEISGNGLSESSYLFGTNHLAPLSICDNIAGFNSAFNSCKQLYGELGMLNSGEVKSKITSFVMLPSDSLLDVLYSPQEYKAIDSVLKIYMGVGVDQVESFKPAYIASQLSMVLYMRIYNDFDPSKQLDATLQRRAKDAGMDVKGLETFEFQANKVFGYPLVEQAEGLLKIINTMNNADSVEGYMRELKETYMQQDLDKLFEYMTNPAKGPNLYDNLRSMVYDRNRDWVEQTKRIFDQPTFIVVGAGHLPGDEGMLNLLRQQGYNVTPVK